VGDTPETVEYIVKNLVQAAIKHFVRHQRMKNWYLISNPSEELRIPGVLWDVVMGGVSESDIRFVDASGNVST